MKHFLALLLAVIGPHALGNVGVFTGYGHSIELTSTDRVQLIDAVEGEQVKGAE